MQRFAAVLLICCYAALGSGAMEYWHNQEHIHEDALGLHDADEGDHSPDHAPIHDESNCPFHCQLHLAGMAVAWMPPLILLVLFVAFCFQVSPISIPRRAVARATCRDPPHS